MAIEFHRYGKSRVRLVKVTRTPDRHELREVTVAVALDGDFESAYTAADNRQVIATDSIKNTVYVLARDHALETIEEFAQDLARHFTSTYPQVTGAEVEVIDTPWERMPVDMPHAFTRGGEERAVAIATITRDKETTESGIVDAVVLKTTDSTFTGFVRDEYTTLEETQERILATRITAHWRYTTATPDYNPARADIRRALLETFAAEPSPSVQHTLHAMGIHALQVCADISAIRLSLPNLHCHRVDLSPFGRTNDNEIFVPVDEPHGLIEATVVRDALGG